MMKPTLELKLSIGARVSQRLALTPQVQQALRLLQMSSLELLREVGEALESNIMLERVEDGAENSLGEESGGPNEVETEIETDGETAHAAETDELPREESDPPENEQQELTDIPREQPVDVSWDQNYDDPVGYPVGRAAAQSSGPDWTEWTPTAAPDLRGRLLREVPLLNLDQRHQSMATVLVDALDAHGWLSEDLETLVQALEPEIKTDVKELETVLRRLRELAPAGVGARDLSECLILQLEQLPGTTPWLRESRLLVQEHLKLMGDGELPKLARRLGVSAGALQEIMQLVKSLDPQPGRTLDPYTPEVLLPDIIVRRTTHGWLVENNPEALPRVRINSHYAKLARGLQKSADAKTLRTHLVEARGLMQNLQRRHSTLLRVARSIVQRQQGFLEHGPEAMRPLVLREIASELELHETTISRATIGKYMATPRGTFELKYFFTSQVQTHNGGQVSSTAVRALLKKLIAEEPPRHPHSDAWLSQLLDKQGIRVARRTVAKYRDSMAIPGCQQRRRMARLNGSQAFIKRTSLCK